MSGSLRLFRFKNILFCIFFLLFLFLPQVCSLSTMEIEVLPPQPVSGQNFTISVYDTSISNTTPYLTEVIISVEEANYTITDELPNRELELTAPLIFTQISLIIKANKTGYHDANKSITILPNTANPPQIFITIINETIVAGSYFSLKVTDKFNNPISNATVSIKNHQGTDTDGFTNKTGYITLKAPNEPEIEILAQKEGFTEDTATSWVQTTQDSTTIILSHPATPIIIAACILVLTILLVTLKNKGIIAIPTSPLSLKNIKKEPLKTPVIQKEPMKIKKPNDAKTAQLKINTPLYHSKIEEIDIKKPHPEKETFHLTKTKRHDSEKQIKSTHHQWFTEKDSIECKVDQLISAQPSKNKNEEWFQGTASIKDAINTTVKQKQKKKNSDST